LSYKLTSVEAALERSVNWYQQHGYLDAGAGNKTVAHAAAA
jgi:hypothetical protein